MKLKEEFIGKDLFSQELNKLLVINEENISIFKELGYNFLFEVEIKPKKAKSDKANKIAK